MPRILKAKAIIDAWPARAALEDDLLLRVMLRMQSDAPEGLEVPFHFEQAVKGAANALKGPELIAFIDDALAEGLPKDTTRWTASRLHLLKASLLPESQSALALKALRRVATLNALGGIGGIQRAQAKLMEGSIEHRSGRYREAIAAFLKVPSSSGLWREARLGMAWSQLRIAQPDRALASLALLPGGLTGDAERALVAAMAAGAMGKREAALAVIEEARQRSSAWLGVQFSPSELLQRVLKPGEALRLRAAQEGLIERLRSHPALRLFAAELRASEALLKRSPDDEAVSAYVSHLRHYWTETLTRIVAEEEGRIREALRALDALEPQLK